ncbi:MAG: PASTA domain-containing protein, partial [Candidatus Hydrogenedentes bacterium]|nr:PASTA domain-containing protein [Candidatus Hydrogenedentota bacterium]
MRNATLSIALACLLLWLSGCPAPNTTPTASAGPDQQAILGATVTLDGSASSDADGDTLGFQWRFTTRPDGSLSSLANAGTAQPTFVPDQPGLYVLSLTVLDTLTSSPSDSVTITVTGNLATVPDLAGLTEAEAGTALSNTGLSLGESSTQSSSSVPAGQVLGQDPVADSEVLPGSNVDIVISTGPGSVSVPDVTGQSQAEAETAITGAGLTVGNV